MAGKSLCTCCAGCGWCNHSWRCPFHPKAYSMSVAGFANAAVNCEQWNANWGLSRWADNVIDRCFWTHHQDSAKRRATLAYSCRGELDISADYLELAFSDGKGSAVTYRKDADLWDCCGPNTLTYHGGAEGITGVTPAACSSWPLAVTVNPLGGCTCGRFDCCRDVAMPDQVVVSISSSCYIAGSYTLTRTTDSTLSPCGGSFYTYVGPATSCCANLVINLLCLGPLGGFRWFVTVTSTLCQDGYGSKYSLYTCFSWSATSDTFTCSPFEIEFAPKPGDKGGCCRAIYQGRQVTGTLPGDACPVAGAPETWNLVGGGSGCSGWPPSLTVQGAGSVCASSCGGGACSEFVRTNIAGVTDTSCCNHCTDVNGAHDIYCGPSNGITLNNGNFVNACNYSKVLSADAAAYVGLEADGYWYMRVNSDTSICTGDISAVVTSIEGRGPIVLREDGSALLREDGGYILRE